MQYKFNGSQLRFKKNRMTQAELASKIGCTPKDISRWENGERSPSMENLFKLAAALHCRFIDELITCKDDNGNWVYWRDIARY